MIKIVKQNGTLVINKDGEILPPIAYMAYVTKNARYKDFIKAGYRTFSICVSVGGCPANEEAGFIRGFEEGFWKGINEYEFSALDKNMTQLLDRGNKDLYVILRVNLNMPNWWRELHKEELTLFDNGETLMQSVFSEVWKSDACLALSELKNHIDNSFYKDNVIGLQVAGMHTEEWIAPWVTDICNDFSKPAKQAFISYCKDKYIDISKLNSEWSSNFSNFEEITPPTFKERESKNSQNPDNGLVTKTRDYYMFFNKGYSDAITCFCKHVKAIYGDQMLAGCFYGYIAQLNCSQGHCSVKALLDCNEIDFFASPFSYAGQRAKAIDWFYHTPMDSVFEAGKLWFIEADVRTCKTKPLYESAPHLVTERTQKEYFDRPVWKGPNDYEDSINNILRSFSKVFISRIAFWWFDMWGGWYKGKKFTSLMSRMRKLYNAEIDRETFNNCEVAVILDQNTSYYVADRIFYGGVYNQFVELGFLGAPYSIFLLDKFDKKIADKYKMLIFTAPRTITEKQEEIIKSAIEKGKTILFTGDENGDNEIGAKACFDRNELKTHAINANVHLYSYGNTVYANNRYVSVTASENCNSETEVVMPFDCRLKSFMDGKVYETENKTVKLKTKPNKTYLLEILK